MTWRNGITIKYEGGNDDHHIDVSNSVLHFVVREKNTVLATVTVKKKQHTNQAGEHKKTTCQNADENCSMVVATISHTTWILYAMQWPKTIMRQLKAAIYCQNPSKLDTCEWKNFVQH